MVRGMLRVVVLAVATLALVVVIYLSTVPAFDHPHTFVFSDPGEWFLDEPCPHLPPSKYAVIKGSFIHRYVSIVWVVHR